MRLYLFIFIFLPSPKSHYKGIVSEPAHQGLWHPVPVSPAFSSQFLPPKTTAIAQRQRAQLDFTFPFAVDASSEMLVVFVSLEVS